MKISASYRGWLAPDRIHVVAGDEARDLTVAEALALIEELQQATALAQGGRQIATDPAPFAAIVADRVRRGYNLAQIRDQLLWQPSIRPPTAGVAVIVQDREGWTGDGWWDGREWHRNWGCCARSGNAMMPPHYRQTGVPPITHWHPRTGSDADLRACGLDPAQYEIVQPEVARPRTTNQSP